VSLFLNIAFLQCKKWFWYVVWMMARLFKKFLQKEADLLISLVWMKIL